MALPIVYKSPENPNVVAAKKQRKEKADVLTTRREKEQQRRVDKSPLHSNSRFWRTKSARLLDYILAGNLNSSYLGEVFPKEYSNLRI
jgi:hypothetical protein